MNRSKSPPPVDLEKYLKGKKHRYCTYAQGARLYAMAYWSFVNICKEAKGNKETVNDRYKNEIRITGPNKDRAI